MKARTLFLLAFLFLCHATWSQVAVLSGKVLDENGEPLPFASVYLENSTYGVSSDGKGRYRLPLYSLPAETILNGNTLFKQFKGALTEQFVLQQHIAHRHEHAFYWENPSGQAEVDFLFESKERLIPLEVKASENLQSKSLKVFHSKHPQISCFRTSLARYRQDEWLTNLPLYALPVTAERSTDSA